MYRENSGRIVLRKCTCDWHRRRIQMKEARKDVFLNKGKK